MDKSIACRIGGHITYERSHAFLEVFETLDCTKSSSYRPQELTTASFDPTNPFACLETRALPRYRSLGGPE